MRNAKQPQRPWIALGSLLLFAGLFALASFPNERGGWLAHLVLAPLCHQELERCLSLGGQAMHLCSRCAGIYGGIALASLMYLFFGDKIKLPFGVIIIALALNIIGFLLELAGIYSNALAFRACAGLALGTSLALYVLPQANRSFQPVHFENGRNTSTT